MFSTILFASFSSFVLRSPRLVDKRRSQTRRSRVYTTTGVYSSFKEVHSRIRECIRSNSNQNYPRKPFPPFSFFFPKSTSALAISQGAHKPHFAYTAHRREEESKLERTTVPVCFFFFLCFFVISSTPLGFCRCKRIATK